jgi:Ni/Fe-hydrogenase subunit HybB-like protein
MSEPSAEYPFWRRPPPEDEDLAHQAEDLRQRHLLLDPRFPWDVNADVLNAMTRTTPLFWLIFAALGGLVLTAGVTWLLQMYFGVGITGLNRPVGWGLYLVNTVYFIGIGHAGTFISAALRSLHIEWRRPIGRAAEIMTVFALGTAALFPVIHLGRSWKVYWLLPYPNQRQLWPNFHSPLMWDFMAILTYLTGSILFVYLGLLPDLAMARDHTAGWRHRLYTILALGWRGTEREWARHGTALTIFSYIVIPVMITVTTIVSWDFAMGIQPGWHSTIFGPYFVIGALLSGMGVVIIILAVVRKAMRLEYFIRDEHFNGMAIVLLLLSMTWAYFYFADYIVPWYGQEPVLKVLFDLFHLGWAQPLWLLMLFSNILLPWATLWSRRVRTSVPALVVICIFVQIGMYIERFLIIPVTLGRNELPFSWGIYIPRLPDILITLGAFALVPFLYLVISRLVPLIPVWEVLEGQILQGLKRLGRALLPSRTEPR